MSAGHEYEAPATDTRISASVKALIAARGKRVDDVAAAIGVSRNPMFAKLRGASSWKASEVEAVADYFDVSVADLFAGLGLLGNTEAPAAGATGASRGGAPSGTRTPDPLIKSQLL